MKRIAIVRGKFLNRYEMQFFEPLSSSYNITAFGSLSSYHTQFSFPVAQLPSPMDIPDIPFKMQMLNRLFVDAHYLFGLESRLVGYDLVHTAETYYHYTQQCLNAKRRGLVRKVIATVLENIPHNNEGIWGRKSFKQRARRELDHMIALTEKTKKTMVIEGADPRRISVIPHFVDTKRFAPKQKTDNRPLTVLFTGRLEPYKGVLDIMTSLSNLHPKEPVRMVFVGKGSAEETLIRMARDVSPPWRIEFASASYDDMPSWYQQADVFVAPSKPTKTWDEQYCTALLEAQAAGLAIVTTKTGGIVENVGDAAILVSPGDTSALSHAIQDFLEQPKKRLEYQRCARMRACRVHDIHIGAAKLAALYERVLSE